MVRKTPEFVEIDIHVLPNAKKTEVVGVHGGRLKVKVHAPPVDGKANDEIGRFFAEVFSRPKSNAFVVRGETSKQKTVRIIGVSAPLLAQMELAWSRYVKR